MIIVGIDLGKNKAALSRFVDGELDFVGHTEIHPDHHRGSALDIISAWCRMWTQDADMIFIEEPLVGRNVRGSLQIAQTAGAVMSRNPDKPIYLVPVSSWKKEVLGAGNADKSSVSTWLDSHHPAYAVRCGTNQDRIDAVCIGLYGVSVDRRTAVLEDV